TEDKVEEEIGKFATAMASTLKQLDTIRKKALDEMGPEEAAIFEAHMQIAQDPSLSDGIKSLVESSHMNVVAATAQTIETFANIFLGMEDAYIVIRNDNFLLNISIYIAYCNATRSRNPLNSHMCSSFYYD
ncbi:Phosphoenolpyruvate-protein phosphotransferase, partial [human gut metagenome]